MNNQLKQELINRACDLKSQQGKKSIYHLSVRAFSLVMDYLEDEEIKLENFELEQLSYFLLIVAEVCEGESA